jgi:hypothetical protein
MKMKGKRRQGREMKPVAPIKRMFFEAMIDYSQVNIDE